MSARRKISEGGSDDFDPLLILRRGVDEWNRWRRANTGFEIYLSGVDLRGADLRGANLEGAYLEEAHLNRANLQMADLQRAILRKANLGGAFLQNAKLRFADLERANLREAKFGGANLQFTILEGANLRESFLVRAHLAKADLKGANLERANLHGANLEGANLEGANLKGTFLLRADLRGARLDGVDFQRTNLREANLEGVNLDWVDFRDSNLEGAIFQDETFRIFTENDSVEDANELFHAATKFLKELGISIREDSGWRPGSLKRKASTFVRGVFNFLKVGDRAAVAEDVFLGKQDIQTTVELTKAVVELEKAFEGKKGAIAIHTGLFIFLRKGSDDGDGAVFFKRLTVDERALLDRDPTLLEDPERLFITIKDMKKISASQTAQSAAPETSQVIALEGKLAS